MATYYDKTYTSGSDSYSIRIDMRTSVVTGDDGKSVNYNTLTATYYDGSVITETLVTDETIEERIAFHVESNEGGIAGAPDAEVDNALVNAGYTRH